MLPGLSYPKESKIRKFACLIAKLMDCVYVRHESVKYLSLPSDNMLTGANTLQSLGQQCALVGSCY